MRLFIRSARSSKARTTFALGAALFMLPIAFTSEPSALAAQRVHVRADARLEVRARRTSDGFLVSGQLTDDAGEFAADAKLVLSVAAQRAPDRAVRFDTQACEASQPPPPLPDGGGRAIIERDRAGRFCLVVRTAKDAYVAHLEVEATSRMAATTRDIAIDTTRPQLTLLFDARPRSVDVERGVFTLSGRADIDEDPPVPASGVRLALVNELGATLAEVSTEPTGGISFEIPASSLGPPGPGEVRVRFAGNDAVAPSQLAIPVERRAHVALRCPDAESGQLAALDRSVVVPIRALAPSTTTGIVEARLRGVLLAAAPLRGGFAPVPIALPSGERSPVPLTFHYVPDVPWLLAGKPLALAVPIRSAKAWQHALFGFVGVALVAWIVFSRRQRAQTAHRAIPKTTVHPRPRIEVRRRARGGDESWSGTVVDAHDGFVLTDARIAVVRRGFRDSTTVIETHTDARGHFELSAARTEASDELVAEASLHARLVQALPARGELVVALVLRRRAVLDRLVAWARSRGRPYDAKPEPTPAQVRAAALSDTPLVEWADAVEQAAFSGAPVDSEVDDQVERLAKAVADGADAAGRGARRKS